MNCDLISLIKIGDPGIGIFVPAGHIVYLEPVEEGTMVCLTSGAFVVIEDIHTIRRKMLNEVPNER